MDPFFEKFIDDLVKGASVNSREKGGPGVNIVVSHENRGYEEKIAGLGGGLGGAFGPIGAAAGAGLQDADAGSAVGGGLGSLAGTVLGMPAGALLGATAGVPIGALTNLIRGEDVGHGALAGGGIGGALGGLAGVPLGSIMGGHWGQNRFRPEDEKRAGLGGGIGGLLGPIPAALGAGLQDNSVRPAAGAAIGSTVGGLLGGVAGLPLGHPLLGALAGSSLGGHLGQKRFQDPSLLDRLKGASLMGVKAACVTFGLTSKTAAGLMQGAAGLMGKGLGFLGAHPHLTAPLAGAGLGAVAGAAAGGPGHRLEGAARGGLVGTGLSMAVPSAAIALTKAHPEAVMRGAFGA